MGIHDRWWRRKWTGRCILTSTKTSDGKFFRINIFYCRYGYKDYGYEDYMQDNYAYEVEKKEIVTTQWVSVK